jgi:predicted Zn-dependent protease
VAEHDPLDPLRAAVARTPGDILLRERLACTLLDRGLAAEAELEYRASLQQAPDNPVLKLGLARAFLAQGKASHALAVVDSLVAEAGVEPAALVLHARLLLGIGEVDQAVRQYKRGVQADPAAADAALGATLGVDSAPRDDVVDGRVRASWNSEDDVVGIPMERPRISFADVGAWSLVRWCSGSCSFRCRRSPRCTLLGPAGS